MAIAAIPAARFWARWEGIEDREARNEVLRERFRGDVAGFLKWIWPDVFTRPFVAPHLDVLTRHKIPWQERTGTQVRTLRALAAPRSFSKTGITIADLCHDCCYGIERVVPILSAELTLSRTSLATIRQMLSAPAVAELYGPVTFAGGTDRYTVTIAGHQTTFIAKSFGTSVRGLKEGMIRPTRLVVDDGEDKLLVNNPDNRRKWWSFLVEDILKLGDIAGGLIVDWIGTVLHQDSVLSRILVAPGWRAKRYAACLEWPERADLWAECGRVWADLSIGEIDDRRAAAQAFYAAQREAMDRGARMLSNEWMDLFAFHEVIWSEGLGSALKELQNSPRDPGACLFDHTTFPRCRVVTLPGGEPAVQRLRREGIAVVPDGRPIPRSSLNVTLRLDPIPGEQMGGLGGGAGGSDYAAIAAIARDPHGGAHVVDGWMRRAKDTDQLAAMWAMGERWHAHKAVIEGNGFARLLGDPFKRIREERRGRGLWAEMSATTPSSTTNKDDDIAGLEMPIANGWITFAEHLPTEAMMQIDDFPGGSHDDFWDAVARGYRDSGGVRPGMVAATFAR